ncbi:MAG: hypothetical protein OZSIB_4273 [Candidatus Ozemobacter sibiricus]|uniref:Uncharacterized protein n=1 Tax=Candidatus Ozemobacter sibiricus TaxID=2268124 RepID=A0A367ZP38_9BACT|nr:MAG: hypothetical protein OZSIB_4273 [Candidatus Ozemobacter sibiricus]
MGALLGRGAPSLSGRPVVLWLILALGLASGVGPPALAGPSAPAPCDVTLYGLSGTMLVPGLDVLPRGMGRAAVHLTGGDAVDQGSFKGVFSFSEDAEVAIMKRFGVGRDQFAYDPILTAKYKVRPSLAVAAIIDTTAGYKDSVMLLSGTPGHRVVLGLGANFAYEGIERHAHFGRYPDRLSPVDNLFFVFGGRLNLDDDTEITMDYAGNDFLVGLRHRFDQNVAFDFGYFLPDRLHPSSRFSLGANFGF